MFSRSREEMIGTPLDDCIDADDWAELKDKMAKVMTAKLTRAHAEVRLKTPQEKFAAVYITPMTEEDEDGKPDVFGFIAHFIDNTERRTLALQFSQAQKMQAIGQLAGGIAHDFNNLLTAIIGSTDLLLQTHPASDPDFTELMNVHYSATRAASLVGQLLSYSRKQPLRPKYLDVTDVFAELHHMLKRLLGTKSPFKLKTGGIWALSAWIKRSLTRCLSIWPLMPVTRCRTAGLSVYRRGIRNFPPGSISVPKKSFPANMSLLTFRIRAAESAKKFAAYF